MNLDAFDRFVRLAAARTGQDAIDGLKWWTGLKGNPNTGGVLMYGIQDAVRDHDVHAVGLEGQGCGIAVSDVDVLETARGGAGPGERAHVLLMDLPATVNGLLVRPDRAPDNIQRTRTAPA